ncbi:MAG: peptidase T [Lachnospiraceae bacterium]|nr:peptidase T [Lachnospiraceae bacterium]
MRAYERLLNYVVVHTTSDPNSVTHPTTLRQFDLARMLVEEMKELGIEDARMDEKCYVYGTLPATEGMAQVKALGLIAHVDTADDASGEYVKPVIRANYDGEDIVLEGTGEVMTVKQFPFLAKLKGQTLITTDGTTLLGADNKAGIAEILTAVERIQTEGLPHGKLCIGFTPDEEVGQGADFFDIKGFGADYAYTVDGGDVGEIEYENFNAASAVVTFHGRSVHPGAAKNTMLNAQNVAMEFHMALPKFERPEHTEGREGFYHLTEMTGDVTTAKLQYIIRDHDEAKFQSKKEIMLHTAACLNEQYGAGVVEVVLKDSYANMIEQIKPHFHLIEFAREAVKKAGLVPVECPIRGGTDGARLSYEGLPCPNLGTGGFNYHGPYECITAEKMDQSVEVLLNIIELFTK